MGHNKTQMIIKSLHNNSFSDYKHRSESTESGTVSFYNINMATLCIIVEVFLWLSMIECLLL